MGILVDAINLESKGNIVNYFKDNTSELYNQYRSPDGKLVKGIPVSDMIHGRFYFLNYFELHLKLIFLVAKLFSFI